MIQSLIIKNFRNFSQREISFCAEKNIIIGNNGQGKSNILEALCLPVNPMVESHPQYLLQRGASIFFLGYQLDTGSVSFSYEAETQKRKYIVGGKNTTKQKLKASYPHVVSFHPMMMNLMYLGPSERRNFLDDVLNQSFPEYKNILQNYKKIVQHRNKVLKNISEKKSAETELDFWDIKFLETAEKVYFYRKKLIDYVSQNIDSLENYFFGKINQVHFSYISKTDIQDPLNSLKKDIKNNRYKEILLRKTTRGPHIDDFDILIDGISLIHFASRGEVKSMILGLKFIETQFIENHSLKTEIIFVIDDLLSELDAEHRNLLWEHIGKRQCIISCIEDVGIEGKKIFI